MSRTAPTKKNILITATVLVALATPAVIWQIQDSKPITPASQTTVKPAETTHLSYEGQDGKTALELLKAKADAQTKSSSLGEYVTAINGNDGGGTKYWLFYVNGKEAAEGAGTYVTHAGETIEWKLQ